MDAERLFALAEQVRAGSGVDWESQAGECEDESEGRIIKSMGVLARIAELHSGDPNDGKQTKSFVHERIVAVSDDGAPATGSWGHLEKLRFIGRGGFGSVYKAWDPTLEMWVALKLTRPDIELDSIEQEMLEEARLMARVRHENVIRIYGTAQHDGRQGIWMEYIEGRTLAQIVEYEGRMDERRVIALGRVLARALAAVHRANVIHKDIKAHNVMLESGGRLVLMDFGSSARVGNLMGEPSNEPLRGTPHYFAPELLDDYAPSEQSDIYSLGVLLFYLLTKHYPLEADTFADLMEAHRNGLARPVIDLRPEAGTGLCHVIDRALNPVPAERYESAGRMAMDLEQAPPRKLPARAIAALVGVLLSAFVVSEVIKHMTTFAVDASLYRVGTPHYELQSGSRVSVHDKLYLEIETSKPLYVYVFNHDDFGNPSLLYPIRGLHPQNPIEPGQIHLLPGTLADQQITWVVTSAGQRERFWMVGSRKPIEELEAMILRLPPAKFDKGIRYPNLDGKSLEQLRGIEGLSKLPTPDLSSENKADLEFFKEITELTGDKEKQRGVWVRRIELANP